MVCLCGLPSPARSGVVTSADAIVGGGSVVTILGNVLFSVDLSRNPGVKVVDQYVGRECIQVDPNVVVVQLRDQQDSHAPEQRHAILPKCCRRAASSSDSDAGAPCRSRSTAVQLPVIPNTNLFTARNVLILLASGIFALHQ